MEKGDVMNRESEDRRPQHAEVSAVEAALAQLRPRRDGRFADQVKNQMVAQLRGEQAGSMATATVRVPLTHYIRIARFNAAMGGLVIGLLCGILLGGAGMYFLLDRLGPPTQAAPVPVTRSQSGAADPMDLRPLLERYAASAPAVAKLLEELERDPHHERK